METCPYCQTPFDKKKKNQVTCLSKECLKKHKTFCNLRAAKKNPFKQNLFKNEYLPEIPYKNQCPTCGLITDEIGIDARKTWKRCEICARKLHERGDNYIEPYYATV